MKIEERSKKPYKNISLLDFQRQFPDEKSCWDYLVKMRWPSGFVCPKCKSKKHCFKPKRHVFECYGCHSQSSVTTGTIFHKSRQPLQKWFWALFLIATSKKGVSMLYLQRQLGIKSYRAAWLMGHKIRNAMIQRDKLYQVSGIVEADEIFIGGKQSLANRRENGSNKTAFLIAVEENQIAGPKFVTFEELETIYEEHVLPALDKKIKKGSKLKTDGAGAYTKAGRNGDYQVEQVVFMNEPEKAKAHLKWVNMLTSNLKRFLLSTYHGVYPKYRKAYLAEFAYRFNRRYWPYESFDRLLYACVNADVFTLRELRA
jgi:transposase-like protein